MARKKHVSRARTAQQSLTRGGFGGKKGASRAKFALSQNNMKQSLSRGKKLDPEEGLAFINEIAGLIADIQEQLPAWERAGSDVRSCRAAANSQEGRGKI